MFKPSCKINADKTEISVSVVLQTAIFPKDKLRINTEFVRTWLLAKGYKLSDVRKRAVASNYEELSKQSATWVFGLSGGAKVKPSAKATKAEPEAQVPDTKATKRSTSRQPKKTTKK